MDGRGRSRNSDRYGYTLIEVLVAVSVVGMVIALLLPAVSAARESARRARCVSNLKQIVTALHSYHDFHGSFPAGRFLSHDARYLAFGVPCAGPTDRSYLVSILANIEQEVVYNSVNFEVSIFSNENSTIHSVTAGTFSCPSDPDSMYPRSGDPFKRLPNVDSSQPNWRSLSRTSYAGFLGIHGLWALPDANRDCRVDPVAIAMANGCITDVAPVSFGNITDGLSNTIVVAEKSTTILQELDVPHFPDLREQIGWWFSGQLGDTLLVGSYPPNAHNAVHSPNKDLWTLSASSLHRGGVNVAFADGSIRFISEKIQSSPLEPMFGAPIIDSPPGVWQKLISRNDGEFVTDY
ncbi:DUF1559 family PulG-like putative transporter [Tautonia sociabilis]|uniref:DUF1559 family PulG-like putative transporter n=1 Tax=Tautonia sociabilis TaxID=2080755 RepID=UPI003703E1E0